MEDITDLKDAMDNLEIEKDDVNVISQMSDREERDFETIMVTDGVNSGDSKLLVLQKQRDKSLIELNIVRQELVYIEKKCFKINELKEKAIKDINDHRGQIAAPDLLKADLEQLQRFKSLAIEKESTMKTHACFKKQAVMFLEQQLAIQENFLHFLMDIYEINKMLSIFTHGLETAELEHKKDIKNVYENLKTDMEFIQLEQFEINKKLMLFTEEIKRDRDSYLSKYAALQKQLEDMSKKRNLSIEAMMFLENEVKNLNLHKTNFEICLSTFNKEFDLTVTAHFKLTSYAIQLLGIGLMKLNND